VTTYSLSGNDLNTGIKLCFDKAERLVDDASLIIRNKGNPSHALVLYGFAIEEYGRGKLLKECKSHVKHFVTEDFYNVDKSIFYSHQKILKKAITCLPDNCKKIDIGVQVTTEYYTTDSIKRGSKKRFARTKRLGGNAVISIPPYLTGLFIATGLNVEKDNLNIEKHIRWPALYIDWDVESKAWRDEIVPDVDRLSNAISSFKKHVQYCIKDTSRGI
jgi:AbiV family abortive infection protein